MSSILAFGMPGPLELAIIGGIIVLLFGSTKVPGLMRNLGRGVTEFKKGVSGTDEEAEAKGNSSDEG